MVDICKNELAQAQWRIATMTFKHYTPEQMIRKLNCW